MPTTTSWSPWQARTVATRRSLGPGGDSLYVVQHLYQSQCQVLSQDPERVLGADSGAPPGHLHRPLPPPLPVPLHRQQGQHQGGPPRVHPAALQTLLTVPLTISCYLLSITIVALLLPTPPLLYSPLIRLDTATMLAGLSSWTVTTTWISATSSRSRARTRLTCTQYCRYCRYLHRYLQPHLARLPVRTEVVPADGVGQGRTLGVLDRVDN